MFDFVFAFVFVVAIVVVGRLFLIFGGIFCFNMEAPDETLCYVDTLKIISIT